MNNNQALEIMRMVQKEMRLWADLDADTKPLCDSYDDAIDYVDEQLSLFEKDEGLALLATVVRRVADKCQIPASDAQVIVFNILGETTTAGIICGLALEIPE